MTAQPPDTQAASSAPTEAVARAVALSRAGHWTAAEALCRQVLSQHAGEATALHVLGVCLLHQGRYNEAERVLDACARAQPNDPAALTNRGIALQALGRIDVALACYRQALQLAPSQPATLNMQGQALMGLQRFDEALASFDRAVAAAPAFAEAWCSRASALTHLRRHTQALDSLDRAEALRPNYGEAASNRSIVLNLLGRHEEALAAARRALPLLPPQPALHRNLAEALVGLQRFEQAVEHCDRAIELAPRDIALLAFRAEVLTRAGRADAAGRDRVRALAVIDERLLALAGDGDGASFEARQKLGECLYERGQLLVELQRHREAIDCFAQATQRLRDFPEAHLAEALNRLRVGDYEQGWRQYEWRRKTQAIGLGMRRFAQPEWLGNDDPAGLRILLHAEQGLGDTIQFCRYAPLLAQQGARVTLLVPSVLKLLLSGLPGVDVIADRDALPAFDRHCPLMSLPFAFRTTLANVPANVPYLRADAEAAQRWRSMLGEAHAPRVGLVWSGNPRNAKDHERSIALAPLAPILRQRAEFISLVKEPRERDLAALAGSPIRRLEDKLTDFAETAALIDCLDLVITVDTSVAHLAGALGKPTWILLDAHADFRWMLEREDSPWYPTARLFRQRMAGDWTAVIERAAQELERALPMTSR